MWNNGGYMTDRLNEEIEKTVKYEKEIGKFRKTIKDYLLETKVLEDVFPDPQMYSWSLAAAPEYLLELLTNRHKTTRETLKEKERIKELVKEILKEQSAIPKES
jgi:hypothetical protein